MARMDGQVQGLSAKLSLGNCEKNPVFSRILADEIADIGPKPGVPSKIYKFFRKKRYVPDVSRTIVNRRYLK